MLLYSDIVRETDPILRKKSETVSFPLSKELQEISMQMREYLVNSVDEELAAKYNLRAGVGLAAPQIRVSKRIIALYFEDENTQVDMILYNPRIISHSLERIYLPSGEGCLSVDRDVQGYVPRYKKITVRYNDDKGNIQEIKASNFFAIVLQHEIDHLNGIMFYDHIHKENPFTIPPNTAPLE